MKVKTYAFTTESFIWASIDWKLVEKSVEEMQHRIVQAVKNRQFRKAKSLQWILTNSFYAKLLAVRKVTSNKGKNTSGVDGVIWNTTKKKTQALFDLKISGYKAKPMRRVFIPKSNGKKRPLAIPTMKDRAMQALFLLALDPWNEVVSDINSYGFRKGRSCQDAIEQCFNCLSHKTSAQWILDADIKGCFDEISHQWIMENVPLNKRILQEWLKTGVVYNKIFSKISKGTPQGGIISPVLANYVLNGIEKGSRKASINTANKSYDYANLFNPHLVNVIRYADDFVITARHKEIIEDKILPFVNSFLKERGLELSEEKTKIVNIEDGFDFLGHNIRKYNGKLIIKPNKKAVKNIVMKISEEIKKNKSSPHGALIEILNPKIRGWANFFRGVCSKSTFSRVDNEIFRLTLKWAKRRHQSKSHKWIKEKYFPSKDKRNWIFQTKFLGKSISLVRMEDVKIVRHIRVKNEAIVYDKKYKTYFQKRKEKKVVKPPKQLRKSESRRAF
jgi:RNA-directed DNA polymerase